METYTKYRIASNMNEAHRQVQEFSREGFDRDHIFVLTHTKEGTDYVADSTGAAKIGVSEEGVLTALANLFRSRGDELRAKMESLDIPQAEAARLEAELDHGKIVVLASED
ncbi:general stress protein [Paenibacillus sp. HJGM_3]|uniref:general stress protein n=1 Tax=Paenibacillus sp. HJGM_3 TaxID=3379816 RepID=UPI00385A32F0